MLADGLAVPAGHAGQAVGDVLDLDVQRRGVEQVEPAARQHALPGARAPWRWTDFDGAGSAKAVILRVGPVR